MLEEKQTELQKKDVRTETGALKETAVLFPFRAIDDDRTGIRFGLFSFKIRFSFFSFSFSFFYD